MVSLLTWLIWPYTPLPPAAGDTAAAGGSGRAGPVRAGLSGPVQVARRPVALGAHCHLPGAGETTASARRRLGRPPGGAAGPEDEKVRPMRDCQGGLCVLMLRIAYFSIVVSFVYSAFIQRWYTLKARHAVTNIYNGRKSPFYLTLLL